MSAYSALILCCQRLLLWLGLLLVSTTSAALPPAIEQAIAESQLPSDEISLWIAPVDGSEALLTWQAQRPRTPASVMKMLTTGTGLALLGPDYRWQTRFYIDGKLENGTLYGNLIIKGYGNPYLVQENMADMVSALRISGLTRIDGDVVLDSSYFLNSREAPSAFDGNGMQPYNAIPHALSINFRTIQLELSPHQSGINVGTDPELTYTRIQNNMQLSSSKRCRGKGFSPRIEVDYSQDLVIVSGQMSKYCPKKRFTKVLTDAGDLFFAHFKKSWLNAGGTLSGSWFYGAVPTSSTLLYTHRSIPLSEQIMAMNKRSNNIMTRQLFLTLGAALTQPPATLKKARAVMMNYFRESGINTNNLFVDNGSGLSRASKISAQQLGQFLQLMHRDTNIRGYFERSLAIAGVDGTLRNRLKNTALAGNAIGKTGTLKNVKSLAGYLTSQRGQKYAYVLLFEGERAKTGRKLMDDILEWLYTQ